MSRPAPDSFEVIVVGAGHAGCEAALAAARLGARCLLMTFNVDHIAALSCNPAVGGLAKGHLVREIDALGGEMGLNTDATGIQFRLLNRGKGPAVWSSRAQVDMDRYPQRMRGACQQQDNLWLLEDEAVGLLEDRGRVAGVVTARGASIPARAVVITTGTFLRGVVHIGLRSHPAGRMGDPPSNRLSAQLSELGLKLARLKTGTTPRLDRRSLDMQSLPEQPGDGDPRMFSFLNSAPVLPQVSCRVSRTTPETHELIRQNLDQAPMYAGVITGVGARYCPSIEDKVVRFPERESHHVFLEPQGLDSGLIYPNGIPTSLPLEVQKRMVRTLEGCAHAHIVRPGYAIEYDFADPMDLKLSLESKLAPGLYLAGQINGTSGYEEAAAQGLMAGINAVRAQRGEGPFILGRSQAYIGVLIDDLVTKGTKEPYRMFTSRAEYRLSLREDNADLRLTPLGRELGLVDERRWQAFSQKKKALDEAWALLEGVRISVNRELVERLAALNSAAPRRPLCAAELLRRPELSLADLAGLHPALGPLRELPPEVARQMEIRAAYAGYEEREREKAAQAKEREAVPIPPDFTYQGLPSLSKEVQEKLDRVRPANLGQAGRISGVTPAALAVLSLHLHKRRMEPKAKDGAG